MADQEAQALAPATLAAGTVLYVVTDPAGTPASEKTTVDDIQKFIDARTPTAETGTTYTFVLADASRVVTSSNAAAIANTIPPNSSVAYPVGTFLNNIQLGAGQITLTPGAGVTLLGASSLKSRVQYSMIGAWKQATDTWIVFGDLQAA